MSIDTVKLLYNDVDNTRFTATDYSNFYKQAMAALSLVRPDISIKHNVLCTIPPAAYPACVRVSDASRILDIEYLVSMTDPNTKYKPRLVDYSEAIAKDPSWGMRTVKKVSEVTEYAINPYVSGSEDAATPWIYVNAVPEEAVDVRCTISAATITNITQKVDLLLTLYMLYLCYSSDSTSQQDQAIAQQYLQEFKAMASEDQRAVLSTYGPYAMQKSMEISVPTTKGGQQQQ